MKIIRAYILAEGEVAIMRNINKNHLIFIVIGTALISMQTYPTLLTSIAERDAWIVLIFSSILLLLFSLLPIKAFSFSEETDLKTIYCSSLGKILGTLFLFLFYITLVLTLIEGASVITNILHINILLETPQWYLLLFFILPALYTVSKGENSIFAITFIGITLLLISDIDLALLLLKYRNIKYILPILKNGINQNFIVCIFKGLALYSGFGILFPIMFKVKYKKKLAKPIVIGLAIVIAVQLIAISGLEMCFSSKYLNSIYYPRLVQSQLINYFDFIESGEIYTLLQIVGGWFIKYILAFYSLNILSKQLKITYKYNSYIISLIVFLASLFLSQKTIILFKVLNYYTYIAFANFIVIPAVIFSVYILKSEVQNKNSHKNKEIEKNI